jgi:hypothetical protein
MMVDLKGDSSGKSNVPFHGSFKGNVNIVGGRRFGTNQKQSISYR